VRIELPNTVLQGLECDANEHGVSVETLILAIVVGSRTGLDDGPGATKWRGRRVCRRAPGT
jgi:hypothetical protein